MTREEFMRLVANYGAVCEQVGEWYETRPKAATRYQVRAEEYSAQILAEWDRLNEARHEQR